MDLIKDIENNILVNASSEEIEMCNKYNLVLEYAYNNSIPLMIKSAEKMRQRTEQTELNEKYFYIRIHPMIPQLFLIIFTTISIFNNKYIITSGVMILIYSLLNYFFDIFTYPQEVDPIIFFSLSYKFRIKWLKIYNVELINNTRKKDVDFFIKNKNEELKKEHNLNEEQLQKYILLNNIELYDELQEKVNKYKIVIYNDMTKNKYIKKALYIIYFLGITNKVYNSGLLKNIWFVDNHNILYNDD